MPKEPLQVITNLDQKDDGNPIETSLLRGNVDNSNQPSYHHNNDGEIIDKYSESPGKNPKRESSSQGIVDFVCKIFQKGKPAVEDSYLNQPSDHFSHHIEHRTLRPQIQLLAIDNHPFAVYEVDNNENNIYYSKSNEERVYLENIDDEDDADDGSLD